MIKKMLIFIFIIVLLSLNISALDSSWGKYKTQRGILLSIPKTNFLISNSVPVIMFVSMSNMRSYYTRFKQSPGEWIRGGFIKNYSYGFYNSASIDYPFNIHDCWLDCDVYDGYVDYKENMLLAKEPFTNSIEWKPYTYTNVFSKYYTCKYSASNSQNKTIGAGCRFTMNPNYAYSNPKINHTDLRDIASLISVNNSHIEDKCQYGSINYCECLIDGGDGKGYCWYDWNAEKTFCDFKGLTQREVCRNQLGIYCNPELENTNSWGSLPACYNIVTESYMMSIMTTSSGDSVSVDEADIPDTEADTSTTPTDSDGGAGSQQSNIDKQNIIYEMEQDAIHRVIVITNLLFLTQIVFSILVLLFYVFQIGVFIYFFTIWIPQVIGIIILWMKKIGGLK